MPDKLLTGLSTYKKKLKLDYPVNIARNVARATAGTHFVFPSDIELYPSPNLIRDFLAMIRRNGPLLQKPTPRVFVSAIFEIANMHSLPNNKSHLVELLRSKHCQYWNTKEYHQELSRQSSPGLSEHIKSYCCCPCLLSEQI